MAKTTSSIGAGTQTLALLDDVPILVLKFRTLNGFPPNFLSNLQQKTLKIMKSNLFYIFIFICSSMILFGQNNPTEFTYNEFFRLCKKIQSISKTNDLKLNEAQANLMQARGAFDPKN